MRNKPLLILFATLLIDMIGLGMVIPIIPIIMTDASSPAFLMGGYSVSTQYILAGALTAIWGFMQFLSAPLFGELSDIYGRKRLLLIGIAILATAQAVFGLGVALGSIALLFISRAVAGLAGGNGSIVQAAVADVSPPENRAKNFGMVGAIFGIAFIIGPLLGGYLAGLVNPAAPFWFAALLGWINFFFVAHYLKETTRNAGERRAFTIWKGIHNLRAAFTDHEVRPLYSANFLYVLGFTFFTSFSGILVVHHHHLSETSLGTFFAIIGLWIIVTQGAIIRFIPKKYDERFILRRMIPVVALALGVYSFMPTMWYIYLLLPFIAIPQGLSMANLSALISKSAPPHKIGATMGINSSLYALAAGVAPLVAGFGSGAINIHIPFIVGSILMLGSWYTLFGRR